MTVRWLPIAIAGGVVALVVSAATAPLRLAPPPETDRVSETVVRHVDVLTADRWDAAGVTPAAEADELTVLRRLSLALHGTIPSLEEIRRFEADERPDRLTHAAAAMLEDPRFGRYFAERFARALVGTATDPFVIFRRDRFTEWLSERFQGDHPFDETARALIAGEGMWTDTPEVNFITAAFANDDLDEAELTARTTRVFLGQRLDCAECHDHPFDDWTQAQFEGLASHFAGVGPTITGVRDRADATYTVQDLETLEDREVAPAVPYHPEWLPEEGRPRERLAAWVTHPGQRRFDRAVVNRVWALMFGQPYLPDRPVDDIPGPDQREYDADLEVLDLLAEDFRSGDPSRPRSVKRLVLTIAASDAFRRSSQTPTEPQTSDELRAVADAEYVWAVRPLVRLRPEQMIGSMIQAASLKTIDQDSHLFVRALRFFRENDFLRDFGDAGEDELVADPGTIPQALLRMNGNLPKELADTTPFTASGRILAGAPDDASAIETAFLAVLTRRPTEAEADAFAGWFGEKGNARERAMQDLYWALFNTPEFSWVR